MESKIKKSEIRQDLKSTFEKLLNESFTKEECLTKGHYLTCKYEPEKAMALLEKKQFGTALKIFDFFAFNMAFDKWRIQEQIGKSNETKN
jgi:hypothetical protein